MPSAEAVNAELRAFGDLVPDVPDHHAEMGYTEQRGQIPMTLPPVPESGRRANRMAELTSKAPRRVWRVVRESARRGATSQTLPRRAPYSRRERTHIKGRPCPTVTAHVF
jgi:hypothetical protein